MVEWLRIQVGCVPRTHRLGVVGDHALHLLQRGNYLFPHYLPAGRQGKGGKGGFEKMIHILS